MADLDEYREKRDFDQTPEPPGEAREPSERPLFVVQEHAASSRHFDFRIEVRRDDEEAVLASWAVPKGPSTDPSEQRLAVRTEDHPLDYADFEGRIPEDEYGGGEVVVWDLGPYRNLTTDDDGDEKPVAEAIGDGHVKIWLEGEKLRGGYALTHARVGGDEDNWLLSKVDDEEADARRKPTSTEPQSVLSGRTVDELADADDVEVYGEDEREDEG